MDPLAQLQDIHVPEHISLWPLAWGWWAVIVIFVVSIALISYFTLRYIRLRKVRKLALQELRSMDITRPDYLNQVNALLKRTCIHYYGNEIVASLHGDSWRRFLLKMLEEKQQSVFESNFTQIQNSMYRKAQQPKTLDAETVVAHWLNHALPPKPEKLQEAQQHV